MLNFSNAWASVFVFLFVTVISLPVHGSAVPELVHYEGFLSDGNGYAVTDGNYIVTFRLYDSFTGGSALWTESWSDSTSRVPVVNGRFRILLGSHEPLTSSFFQNNPNTFLGVTVGSDSEMVPRQRIASVPYALSSPGSGVPSGVITMWSGAISNIPEGWAICDGSNGTPDLRNRFVVGAGGTYAVEQRGGSTTKNINHTHSTPSHTHTVSNHTHTINHQHYVTRVNNGTSWSESGHGLAAGGDFAGITMNGSQSPATSGAAGSGTTGSAGSGTTGTGGSTNQDIMPPYYALAFIMKL